jgi:hypothetical protein
MEVPGGKNMKGIVCFYEALGTCFLLVAVNWGAVNSTAMFSF